MKYKIIIIGILTPYLLLAQNSLESFLQEVEVNNKTLIAARQQKDVHQTKAKTGIYLANPEVSFDYLKGNQESISEIVVSQSFDFPTSYLYRKKISNIEQSQAEEAYRKKRLEVLTEAAENYARIYVNNRRLLILSQMDSSLQKLQYNTEKKLQVGEANILETNRIRMEALQNHIELEMSLSEEEHLELTLLELNGGNFFDFQRGIDIPQVDKFFNDSLVSKTVSTHPSIQYWSEVNQSSEHQIKLQKSLSLPSFNIGYRQDIINGTSINGVSAGISVPLFEKKNQVKLARDNQSFAQENMALFTFEVKSELQHLIEEYESVLDLLVESEETLASFHAPDLLIKAYELGQINYSDFFAEYSQYKTTLLAIENVRLKVLLLGSELYVLFRE